MKRKYCTWLLVLMTSSVTSFSYAYFCPSNFNQIDAGATIDQVTQICGKPDKQETKEVEPEGPQEWTYFISQTVSSGSYQLQQGTLKTTITFDKDGKAINISVNGIGVGSSTICGATPIQLDATRDQIKKACGEPAFINKQANPNTATGGSNAPQKTVVTTFTYNTNPPVTLTFEDGKLKSQ